MRILLVEDLPNMMKNYIFSINHYDENIEIVVAKSFSDLQTKLLTTDFDTAIVDNDLSNWGHSDFNIRDGKQLCDWLIETKNFKDTESSIFLYTARGIIARSNEKLGYTVIEKYAEKDLVSKFQSNILDKMKNKAKILPPLTLSAFQDYPVAKKIQYYKKIINKDKQQARFTNTKEDVLWASAVGINQAEIVCPQPKNTESSSVNSYYRELDEAINKTDKPPAIFWNYSDINLLSEQKEYIDNVPLKNDFIELFFKISFAKNMASYLLDAGTGTNQSSDLLQMLDRNDPVTLRETQCQVIDIMSKNSEKEPEIKKELSYISKSTKYEIVEYFEATLDSFEASSDTAQVRLRSKIDPDKHFKKEFSYKRLQSSGIKYKETNFMYCVSEYQGEIRGYMEPY